MNNVRRLAPGPHQPYRAPRPANINRPTPMLTIERAIADGISPKQLRMVADSNERTAKGSDRLLRQAQHLRRVADKIELLGYGRRAA